MISLEGITSKGLVNVDYPDGTRSIVKRAITSWQRFCSLSKEAKKRFVYADEENLDGAGYELKEEKARTKDLKENFHVTLKALERLSLIANERGVTEADFIMDAEDVIATISPLIFDFAQAVEERFKLEGLLDEVKAGRDNWFLRYLHYFGDRQVGEEIASSHCDKSGFTLHLFESDPGLQYLELYLTPTDDGKVRTRKWREMPVSEGQTVIIPNMQLQYKSKGALKALCHRVVATESTAKTGRYSMVCFIPFLQTPAYDKASRGRTQEFAPGFNYGMPIEEFSSLFV